MSDMSGGATEFAALDAAGVARELGREPLFHMSLGSKELFHSNLLAWFARSFPEEAVQVFGRWTASDPTSARALRVERELKSLDLVLDLPGLRPLVIENKVLSAPDEAQLDRYAAGPIAAMSPQPELALLTLVDPGWPQGIYTRAGWTWRHLGYAELGRSIAAVVDFVARRQPFEGEVLRHYCRLIDLLGALNRIARVRDPSESVTLGKDVMQYFQEARVSAIAQKIRMAHVAHLLRERLAAVAPVLKIKTDFTRGGPLIEVFVDAGAEDLVGWQYQGDQFRLAMVFRSEKGKDPATRARRIKRAAEHEGWFAFDRLHEVLGTTDATTIPARARRLEAGQFLHFDPDFVYRYRQVKGLSVAQLLDIGARYAIRAKEYASQFDG